MNRLSGKKIEFLLFLIQTKLPHRSFELRSLTETIQWIFFFPDDRISKITNLIIHRVFSKISLLGNQVSRSVMLI